MEARRATPSRVGLCVECGFDWDSQRDVVLAGFGPAVDLVRRMLHELIHHGGDLAPEP